MNGSLLPALVLEKGIQAFCWMLLHSFWQGLLLALLAGAVLLFTRQSRPAIRYLLFTVLFFLFVAGCVGTFVYEWKVLGAATQAKGVPAAWIMAGFENLSPLLIQFFTANAHWIVVCWFLFFCFRCWQLSRAWATVRSIRNSRWIYPASDWKAKVNELAQALQIRKTVTLLETGITRVPVVIGHLKPVIYMPLGLLANLPPDQVEAVLLHELAHIRRNDYLVNLVQNAVESIFFFNPGLLWLTALMREEREHCCDDMALSHTNNKRPFIQALISFKEYSLGTNHYVMAFPGRKHQLIRRVARIIDNRHKQLTTGEKCFLLASLLICMLLVFLPVKKERIASEPVARVVADALPVGENRPVLIDNKVQPRQLKATDGNKPANKRYTVQPRSLKPAAVNGEVVKHRTGGQRAVQLQEAEQQHLLLVQGSLRSPMDEQAKVQRESAQRKRVEADAARVAAEKHRQVAEQYRQEAARHREEAALIREQAAVHRVQAEGFRKQAEAYRLEAEKIRLQAEDFRKQNEVNRQHIQEKNIHTAYYPAS